MEHKDVASAFHIWLSQGGKTNRESLKRVAEEVGVSERTIYRWINKYDWVKIRDEKNRVDAEPIDIDDMVGLYKKLISGLITVINRKLSNSVDMSCSDIRAIVVSLADLYRLHKLIEGKKSGEELFGNDKDILKLWRFLDGK